MSNSEEDPNLHKLCELGYKHLLKHVIKQLIFNIMRALFLYYLIFMLISQQDFSKCGRI